MKTVLLAIILFGFIHPGSKLILESGLPLSYFCTLFVGIRLIFQIPIFMTQNVPRGIQKKHLATFALFGLVGCSLQFFEFKAISDGLTPNTVTFLMFSYPIWLTLVSSIKNKSISIYDSCKSTLIVVGLFLITGSQFYELNSLVIVYPILAGLSIALWAIISNKLRSEGLVPITLSVYYDLFSLIALILLFSSSLTNEYPLFVEWINQKNFFILIAYSIILGLVPNLLFYSGCKFISTSTITILMCLEPLLSTLYSKLIWSARIESYFIVGGVFVLIGTLPIQLIAYPQQNKELP